MTISIQLMMLARKTQKAFKESSNIYDSKSLEGRFGILDMLDQLDKDMAKEKPHDPV